MGLLPGGRGSELARELSGTDSETVTYGTSGTIEVAGLAAGPRQFANKFAPTPCGQNLCIAPIRLLPGVSRLVQGA
ncbi:hypothetical protein DNF23_49465 [Pseudomonas syringae pv. pisi]